MGKSRWAVARGLGSLALLLAGCGGSPSSSTAASGSLSSEHGLLVIGLRAVILRLLVVLGHVSGDRQGEVL